MTTKEIAKLIDKERRLKFDQQSKYMSSLNLSRQYYSIIMERLEKEDSRVSYNLINKLLEPLGYKLDTVKLQN